MKKKTKSADGRLETPPIEAFTEFSSKQTDPQGMYTGNPVQKGEQPVQDADDL